MKKSERSSMYGQQQPQQQQQQQQPQQPMMGYGMATQPTGGNGQQMTGYGQMQPQMQPSVMGYGQMQPSMNGYGQMQQQQQQQQQQQRQQQRHQPQMQQGYGMMQQQGGYGGQQQTQMSGYGQMMKKQKQKVKKVYVPIVIRKKKNNKKQKTIAIYKGFYIPGGTQIFGKFKKIKDCKKACEITPTCFAADYNPGLKKCYIHSNITACASMRTHPKLIHFKKVPCSLLETPRGLVTLGTQIFGGLEQTGIKGLQDCIKKCATAGNGIADTDLNIGLQTCFGIDYDFGSHKCYFHTDEAVCVIGQDPIQTPRRLSPSASTINIIFCPMAV